jgi:peptidoglycan/LPS O-acetylase OafA/YrhL
MGKHRFGTLDGLRGIAAFVVLIGHMSGPFFHIVPHGYLAVDLFFLMSGFVIAGAYEQKLLAGWALRSFFAARLKRLWPLYALSFVVSIVCYLIMRSLRPAGNFLFPSLPLTSVVAMGLLFLPQFVRYGGGGLFPLNPAAWSLSVEIWGNLAYACVARSLSNKLLKILIAIGAVGLAMASIKNDGLNVGVSLGDAIYGYIRYAFSFPLGVLLWRLHVAGRLPRFHVPPPLVLLIAAVLLSSLPPRSPIFDIVAVVFAFPVILIAAVANEPGRKLSGLFAWAGAVSYPLYILHEPITGLLFSLFLEKPWYTPLVLSLPPLFVLMAALADRWFDRPLQRWLSGRLVPLPSASVS